MSDIIQLLPDSIANQIAAGEVIQRPASVVKELVENSLDAGATQIQIVIKDAGRTLIQVIDNGKGMSGTDARMAFERHATSKIRKAEDLFCLHTMGFRGEALPSIAAISQVEIKTKRAEDEVGTLISISASKVEKQEFIACPEGTTISVKNIFFNVPARRRFLSSNETERRNILTEIERIVLVNPTIEFIVYENDVETIHLPISGLKQRIVNLERKNLMQQLIEIDEKTMLGDIHGYVSRPENVRKGKARQFFFVNGRYIRHAYFHRAVMSVFDPLITPNSHPDYFIYFTVNPESVDVNIHPTKTEVKFENEKELWKILSVTIREALGKFNAVPTIDFDQTDAVEIPIYDPDKQTKAPEISLNPNYNPFSNPLSGGRYKPTTPSFDWEVLYNKFENESEPTQPKEDLFGEQEDGDKSLTNFGPEHYHYKQRYILTSVKSGLMIIDQHRAHIRILYEKYLKQIKQKKGISQRVLFPEMLELSNQEVDVLELINEEVMSLGFDLNDVGGKTFEINGVPAEIENSDAPMLIRSMIKKKMDTPSDVRTEIQEMMALSLANNTAIYAGKQLSEEEMLTLVNQLFACDSPNHTPDGKAIITVISDDEISRKMK
ncbi:MAG: DNA mismatch repair endonuclease MutL [Dysgonamonadaceae bacterium]|nr:DNA mismatch repair endonuclease MutL [Dysgonamonadaceae bacterium]MDD3309603.1 DNA mismatch repair endonuclease MutL [Dysgonamonadaceae bacterium]MDD3900288.1 DNA mismatch repair endonuclease MutL [Dysgonamonadaceae bacterium]MDD4398844.1 DNA mismatch repair endonuclease MutL [Dysgonamonadaceae bacterium]